MNALDDYKRKSGRMFPTCSEILEVIKSMGYTKAAATKVLANPDIRATIADMPPITQG